MMRWANWREVGRERHPHTVDGHVVDRLRYEFTRAEWLALKKAA